QVGEDDCLSVLLDAELLKRRFEALRDALDIVLRTQLDHIEPLLRTGDHLDRSTQAGCQRAMADEQDRQERVGHVTLRIRPRYRSFSLALRSSEPSTFCETRIGGSTPRRTSSPMVSTNVAFNSVAPTTVEVGPIASGTPSISTAASPAAPQVSSTTSATSSSRLP